MMMAASGIVYEDGKLLCLRDLQGFWAGIGGWIDAGESPEDAIVREVREELGVDSEVVRHFRPFIAWNVVAEAPAISFLLFPHAVRLLSTEFRPDPAEVTDVAWVALNDLHDYEMLPQIRAIYHLRLPEWVAAFEPAP
jgi:8-oxo-dGTP diphosphatase